MNDLHKLTCAKCGQPVTETTLVRVDRPISRGNPYPEDYIVCQRNECIEAAEQWVDDMWEQLRDEDEE